MCEYNEDELIPPTWLNEEFFKIVLNEMEESKHLNVEILDLSIQPASKKGDHYASIMFRATFKYKKTEAVTEPKTTSNNKISTMTVVIKTVPTADTEKGQNLGESHLFENELKIFLYATLIPHPVLVLEDLCLHGYDVLRERLFNYNEVKACLNKLAKWHAISYKMTKEKPSPPTPPPAPSSLTTTTETTTIGMDADADNVTTTTTTPPPICNSIQQMQYGLFTAKNLLHTDYIRNGMHSMILAMEQSSVTEANGGDFAAYLPKLRALEPKIIENCIAMNNAFANIPNNHEMSSSSSSIYVLNHGDFHTRNIMIRKDNINDTLEDMLFIDFQICFFGPSCYDLQYASFTLFDKELRDHKREELLSYYFACFIECLKKLQFKHVLPVYSEFKADAKRWRCFELFLMSTFMPLTKLGTEAPEIDINLIFSSSTYRQTFYNNPIYLSHLKELLPKYLSDGYLD